MPFIVGVRVQVGMFDPFLIQRMGSDVRVPWPDERPDFPLDFGCVPRPVMSRLALRLLGTAWLREGHPNTFRARGVVDGHRDLARGLGRSYHDQGHPGRPGFRRGDRRPHGRHHHVESWYVPCSCGSSGSFRYHMAPMPCVGRCLVG